MDYRNKLKLRLYTAAVCAAIGIILILMSITGHIKNEIASSFGAMFVVIGAARILQYVRITKDEESLHRREIAEKDERNVMLWTKARSLTFTIYILLSAAAVVILYLLDMASAAKTVSYMLCALVFIYWVCYFFVSRRY